MSAVPVAVAALLEAGRPDLAEKVRPNRAGRPMMRVEDRLDSDVPTVARAFWLGHLTIHPEARLDRADWAIDCPVCWDEAVAFHEGMAS